MTKNTLHLSFTGHNVLRHLKNTWFGSRTRSCFLQCHLWWFIVKKTMCNKDCSLSFWRLHPYSRAFSASFVSLQKILSQHPKPECWEIPRPRSCYFIPSSIFQSFCCLICHLTENTQIILASQARMFYGLMIWTWLSTKYVTWLTLMLLLPSFLHWSKIPEKLPSNFAAGKA